MPELPPTPTSHSFISQRLRLHYLDWGNPDAPTLILQHGGRDHARSWDWVAHAMCKDWHVVAPDLRGHGDSAWSPDAAYQSVYMAYDFAQFVDQLGQETVSLVAHSLGGKVATRYAGIYPEKIRRLVNIEGFGQLPPILDELAIKTPAKRWRDWVHDRRNVIARRPRRYQTIEGAFARMREENVHLSDEQAMHLTIHGVIRNEDGTFSWKFDNLLNSVIPLDIPEADHDFLVSQITCPVLLPYGRKSWANKPEETGEVDLFQDARAVAFEHSGHWPHHDEFERFVAMLKQFL